MCATPPTVSCQLQMCYGHGLKICMWFPCSHQIIFVIFSQFELSHFFGHFSEWIPCVRNFSYSLIPILLKLYSNCDQALNICMWLGYTPLNNFRHDFHCNVNLVILRTFSHLKSEVPVGGHVIS